MLIKFIAAIALFGAGVLAGWFFLSREMPSCESEYSFINRDIVCGSPDIIRKTGYIEAQQEISNYTKKMQSESKVSEAAIYFRDLKHGPTFGINELADFAPASLLKLPLAFVYLRSAEVQPELLSTKIQYTGTTTVAGQTIKPRQSAEPNRLYTIEELLSLMLSYSDNASYETLEQFLVDSPHRSRLRLETFQELGLIDPKDRVEESITVRGYASLFRLLYNISYLNEEYSEKTLKWLSESDYKAGLVAGVPEGTLVAHKFGERYLENENIKQLHDCGIIYYPENPYLLCIMAKGSDWNNLEGTIAEISKIIYKEVDSRRY